MSDPLNYAMAYNQNKKKTTKVSTSAGSSKKSVNLSNQKLKSAMTYKHHNVTPVKKVKDIEKYPPNFKETSWYTTYLTDDQRTAMTNIRKMLNIEHLSNMSTFKRNVNYYNRFKLPTLDDSFIKGFAHVFFTKPDCNISYNDPVVEYARNRGSGAIVDQLQQTGTSQGHDFMLYLSNKASSFSLSDEYIENDIYGKTWGGWKIAIGRNNIDSKSAGEFTITYNDDRNLNVYLLHKIWVEYIAGVYDGRFAPHYKYIVNKVIDYASSCYYILTAEDGETIIFWSKYYGVFPTTIPSSQYSWAAGNILEKPTIDINYKFSFKEDYNPMSLLEINNNAKLGESVTYSPIYEPKLGHSGTTWVGVPFIAPSSSGDYLLRFAKKSI